MVYFIRAGQDGPIKIGYSESEHSLKRRLAALQVGNHEILRPLAVAMNAGQRTELRLHELFAESRLRPNGEWFDATPELLGLVFWVKAYPYRLDEYIVKHFKRPFRPPPGRPKKACASGPGVVR